LLGAKVVTHSPESFHLDFGHLGRGLFHRYGFVVLALEMGFEIIEGSVEATLGGGFVAKEIVVALDVIVSPLDASGGRADSVSSRRCWLRWNIH
jgi:hypothetical protein